MNADSNIDHSRRKWLRRVMLIGSKPEPVEPVVVDESIPRVAIIQGRHCLAYQRSFCSVCSERCPVEGAIKVENGIPQVVAAACTGCNICHEVCPAPTNAILMRAQKEQARHV